MTEFIPDPISTYKPKQPIVRHDAPSHHPANAIREGLTDDDLRTMAREKLSALLQSIDHKNAPGLLLSVVRETMDRIDGKATQRIEQKVEHSSKGGASELTTEQLVALLSQAHVAGLLPSGMSMQGDGTLVTDAEYVEVKADC